MNRSEDVVQKLAYGISHDMGAQLRSIVQFSKLLEDHLDKQLDDKTRYWLQLVHQGGENAQAMVEAMLRYSRLNADMDTATHFSLNKLVKSVIDEHVCQWHRSPSHSLQIHCNVSTDLPDIYGLRDQWYLFFTCVLENALLYQPKAPTTHEPRIHIYSEKSADTRQITIEDNGIGVSESRMGELTRPFMRDQSGRDYPGIGMGLSYCDRIAQLHGGTLALHKSSLGGLAVTYAYQDDGEPNKLTEQLKDK
ncbi:hypothetical protein MNBD_GAMMA13-836 [hydrothermal vent metagenome]|uniref:histidine kinase n=1 Tax=hydrothermal vent metagenome TaxID=652676 RepID=A0A3B0ZKF6_9ZZZZ